MALQRYSRPSDFADFADFDRNEYFVTGGQHRDSDTLTRSNHRSILKALGGESDTVRVIRDSHFAVGWVEAIYIHESDTKALAIAREIADSLEDYPVVNEDDWSELQCNEACEYWQRMPVSDRVDVCQRFHISVFAARRDELPEDPQGGLIDYLADGV
jgi:hypothetical protein